MNVVRERAQLSEQVFEQRKDTLAGCRIRRDGKDGQERVKSPALISYNRVLFLQKFPERRSADAPLFPFLFPEFLAWAKSCGAGAARRAEPRAACRLGRVAHRRASSHRKRAFGREQTRVPAMPNALFLVQDACVLRSERRCFASRKPGYLRTFGGGNVSY